MIPFSTGSAGLDKLIEELQPQDNVVFFTTGPEDYHPFVVALVRYVAQNRAQLVHVRADGALDRFVAQHPFPLVFDMGKDPSHDRQWLEQQVERVGSSAYYVFDPLLSFVPLLGGEEKTRDLFLTLCPQLFDLRSVAYWDLAQNHSSASTIAAIRDCTQIFIRVVRQGEQEWQITPLKVWGRYSDAMFQPHSAVLDGDDLIVTPAVQDFAEDDAYIQALAEKNRELAEVRDILNQRNQELYERNRQLAELNSRVAEQSRLYESLRINLDHMRSLFQAGWDIGASLVLDQVYDAIMAACQRLFSGCSCRLYITDSGAPPVDQRDGNALADEIWSSNNQAVSQVRNQVLDSGQAVSHRLEAGSQGGQACSIVLAPIVMRGRPLGTLEIHSCDERLHDPESRMLLGFLASEAGIALENAYLYQETDLQREQLRSFVDDVIKSDERESRQLALDLHDGLVQMIVGSYQHLQTAQAWRERDPAVEEKEVGRGIQILRQAIYEARRLISQLRPAGLDDFGLEHALRVYLGETRSVASWSIDLAIDPEWPALPPVVEASIFRIVQEATTNAHKYAEADELRVRLELQGGDLVVSISDQGKGFDPASVTAQPEKGLHMGLVGIRERARLLGGRCHVNSAPGEGTSITVTIPRAAALAFAEEET